MENEFKIGSRRYEVQQEILRICENRYVSKHEITKQLGLSEHTVRAYYLYPMIRRGELQLLFPEHPRSQSQAFRKRA